MLHMLTAAIRQIALNGYSGFGVDEKRIASDVWLTVENITGPGASGP
jgi:hypothetical protein